VCRVNLCHQSKRIRSMVFNSSGATSKRCWYRRSRRYRIPWSQRLRVVADPSACSMDKAMRRSLRIRMATSVRARTIAPGGKTSQSKTEATRAIGYTIRARATS